MGSLSIAAVVFLASTIAHAINIDGNVRGFAEGYAKAFGVTIDVEDGPVGVTGAQLFLFENAEAISVGLILPRTFNDNTYGANKASDWGDKDHFLMGGGNGLEGSDKWEIIVATLPGATVPSGGDGGDDDDGKKKKGDKKKKDDKKSGGRGLELKLDYIHSYNDNLPEFDTRIESFKVNGQDVDEELIDFETSLSYNLEELDLPQFFDPDKNNPIASPGPLPAPLAEGGQVVYDFESPAEEWLADIMFEFELKKSAFDSSGFSLTTETFVENFFTNSIFHMSPNKLGGHKGFVNTIIPTVTPPSQQQPVPPQLPVQGGPANASGDIPEPASLMLIAGGVTALCMNRRRRRLAA